MKVKTNCIDNRNFDTFFLIFSSATTEKTHHKLSQQLCETVRRDNHCQSLIRTNLEECLFLGWGVWSLLSVINAPKRKSFKTNYTFVEHISERMWGMDALCWMRKVHNFTSFLLYLLSRLSDRLSFKESYEVTYAWTESKIC